jgi:hypothetical protein
MWDMFKSLITGAKRIQEEPLKLQRAVLYDRDLIAPVQTLPTVDRAQLVLLRVTRALNYKFRFPY